LAGGAPTGETQGGSEKAKKGKKNIYRRGISRTAALLRPDLSKENKLFPNKTKKKKKKPIRGQFTYTREDN